jgi:hypothetical protein
VFELLILIVIIVLIVRSKNEEKDATHDSPSIAFSQDEPSPETQTAINNRDRQWRDYLAAVKNRLSSSDQKDAIDQALTGAYAPDAGTTYTAPAPADSPDPTTTEPAGLQWVDTPETPAPTPTKAQTQFDNALLLLYLGAFLFVASAGLFVAFAGFSGIIRTLIVAIVAALFYIGGLYLHEAKPRLKQAGISFATIGMVIAPLVGLSLYAYVFDEQYGALIWSVTSIGTLLLYLHALRQLRYTFVSYLLIFSFVSMLQSSVAILEAPVYYFIWMLIIAGLALRFIAKHADSLDLTEIEEPSYISSQIIIPISLFVALVSVGAQGTLQLAISLLLASIYYGLEASDKQPGDQRNNLAQGSHALGMSAIAVAAYSISTSLSDAATALIGISLLHSIWLVADDSGRNAFATLFGVNALILSGFGVILSLGDPILLVIALLTTTLLGLVIAFRQQQFSGLVAAMIAIGALPLVIGAYALDPRLEPPQLALFLLLGPIILAGIRYLLYIQKRADWLYDSSIIFGLLSLPPAIAALASGHHAAAMAVYVSIATIYLALAKLESSKQWGIGSTFFILGLVFYALLHGSNPLLTLSLVIGVVWNIALALEYRDETPRWIGSLLWFGLPFTLEVSGWGISFSSAAISWAFIIVLVGFILARAIARGVILRSATIPMASYESHASLSYVFGYLAAGVLSLLYGLDAANSSLQIGLVAAALIILSYVTARFVEKSPDLGAAIPVLLQILLLAAFSPDTSSSDVLNAYLFSASIVALLSYTAHYVLADDIVSAEPWRITSTITLFIAPASLSVLWQALVMMPIGLLLAGGALLVADWQATQDTRERNVIIMVTAVLWLMLHFDVSSLQAYTHVIAAMFAGFSYWRHSLGDKKMSDHYLKVMFFVATVPLALQAMGGTSGDMYGWWLILEQVAFILLGMSIAQPFLTRWGLYVALAAVLYQLRDLGWAALTVLAIFIIGLALNYLNRSQDPDR